MVFTKVKIFKFEKENIYIIPSINALSLFISSLFYELLNIKMGLGFYKHLVYIHTWIGRYIKKHVLIHSCTHQRSIKTNAGIYEII